MKKLVYTLAVTGVALALAAPAVAANYDDNTDGGVNATRTSGSVVLDNGQIADLQQKLSSEGFSAGVADGVLGPRTRAAIRRFQEQNGLAVTGTATDETLTQLGVTSSTDIDARVNNVDSNADADINVDSDNNSETYR